MGALSKAGARPIATLRTTAAGGKYGGSVQQQIELLRECGKAGAAIIDLEVESAEQADSVLNSLPTAAQLLISYHDYRESPSRPAAVLKRPKAFPAP